MDEILFEKIGVHFLEPIATYETVAKAKPKLKKLAPPVQSYLDYKTRSRKFIKGKPLDIYAS